ncbi:MAG: calcium-binding protein [Sedimentitalea sp.]
MLTVILLTTLGLAITWGIVDAIDDDDDTNPATDGVTESGTGGDDTLTGTPDNDILRGLLGDDTLTSEDGDDRLFGGLGNDVLNAGAGNDLINGNEGNDVASGGSGDDTINGQQGNDVVFGRDGEDDLSGDFGRDWVDGGQGDDTLRGGPGRDLLAGGDGEDTLQGGNNDDILIGGSAFETVLTDSELVDLRDDIQDGLIQAFRNAGVVDGFDDQQSDTLSGGFGNDILYVGDGDIATGDGGQDSFVLLDGDSTAVAEITDFDTDQDALIYVQESGAPTPLLALTDNQDGTQTLSADDIAVAVITSATLTIEQISIVEAV